MMNQICNGTRLLDTSNQRSAWKCLNNGISHSECRMTWQVLTEPLSTHLNPCFQTSLKNKSHFEGELSLRFLDVSASRVCFPPNAMGMQRRGQTEVEPVSVTWLGVCVQCAAAMENKSQTEEREYYLLNQYYWHTAWYINYWILHNL